MDPQRWQRIEEIYHAALPMVHGQRAIYISSACEGDCDWGGGHGVFTWSVLQGLNGGADRNGDKVITTGELFDFVSEKVRQETQGRQNPRALPGTNRNFPLARVAK